MKQHYTYSGHYLSPALNILNAFSSFPVFLDSSSAHLSHHCQINIPTTHSCSVTYNSSQMTTIVRYKMTKSLKPYTFTILTYISHFLLILIRHIFVFSCSPCSLLILLPLPGMPFLLSYTLSLKHISVWIFFYDDSNQLHFILLFILPVLGACENCRISGLPQIYWSESAF